MAATDRCKAGTALGNRCSCCPQDILGTYIAKLHIFDHYGDTDPTVRDIVVIYLTKILVTVLTALICFRLAAAICTSA